MTCRRRVRSLSIGSVTLAAVLLATVAIRAADDPAARPPPDPGPTSQGFSCSVAATVDTALPVPECEGLVDLYDLLGGAGWPHHYDWRRANQVCDRWQGVTCEQVEGGAGTSRG